MARYYGHIGYSVATETAPGVWSLEPIEKEVYGSIVKDNASIKKGEDLNDDINMNMKITFVADAFSLNNYLGIKYATNMGIKWKIKSMEVEHPRIILTLGEVYNG